MGANHIRDSIHKPGSSQRKPPIAAPAPLTIHPLNDAPSVQYIWIIEQGIMQLRDELPLLAWAFTATGEALLPAQLLGRQPALDGFRIGRLFFIVTIRADASVFIL